MTIKVHIDRLVLEGMPMGRDDEAVVKRAMEEELGRLLSQGGLSAELASGGSYPVVDGKDMNKTGSGAGETGKGIARAVYGGIGR